MLRLGLDVAQMWMLRETVCICFQYDVITTESAYRIVRVGSPIENILSR